MIDTLATVAVAFGVVFAAELGDKTQLLALGFGARHPIPVVAAGLVAGYGLANLLAAVVGGVLGAAFPERPVEIMGGVVFLVFAVRILRPSESDGDAPARAANPASKISEIAAIATAIAVAEMGDKTQIATATLAAQSSPIAVWAGATLGAASSGMVGAGAGRMIGPRVRPELLRWGSAALFAAFGGAMLAGWF